MRRRYTNPDDYAYDHAHAADCGCATCNPGYFHNPALRRPSATQRLREAMREAAKAGDAAEAESRRVMAIVQYVQDRVSFSEQAIRSTIDQAKKQKKYSKLLDKVRKSLSGIMDEKRQDATMRVLECSAYSPVNVSAFHFLDFDSAQNALGIGLESLSEDKNFPGVLLQYQPEAISVGVRAKARRYGAARRRTMRIPQEDTFLSVMQRMVTDSDVRNAVQILESEGFVFGEKEYKEILDENGEIIGDEPVFRSKKVRTKEAFLAAEVQPPATSVVLRIGIESLVNTVAQLDFDFGPDDVVYEYAGTNNTVAGASGRGMYVARLRPTQLLLEGLDQCICVNTYVEEAEAGRIVVFSIRTQKGHPKFTISAIPARARVGRKSAQRDPFYEEEQALLFQYVDFINVEEIKGKGNRLPGFVKGSREFKGQAGIDEMRLIVDFLLHIGLSRAQVAQADDLRAGLIAMQRQGINPFVPPQAASKPARVGSFGEQTALPPAVWPPRNEPRENPAPDALAYTDPEVAALAEAAYSRPMGGVWSLEHADDEDEE